MRLVIVKGAEFKMAIEVQNAKPAGTACWSCGAQVAGGADFCRDCGKLQPPAERDYFSIFGLPRKLNLDVAQLEREFYRLSRKLHPDLFVNASEREREWSLEKSSQLNDAYRTLKDPISRTQYLLGLEGVKVEEQSKAATDRARATGEEKKQVAPPDLLEEVFELNMQLQELKMGGGQDGEGRSQLQAAKNNFGAKLEALGSDLRQAWGQWDAMVDSGAGPESVERLRLRNQLLELLNRRTYIRNLVRDVNEALQS